MSKYKHAIFYMTGFDDPLKREVSHYEEDKKLGPMIEEIYRGIDRSHYLKKTELEVEVGNPDTIRTLSSYFRWMGFHVAVLNSEEHVMSISWGKRKEN